MIMVIARVRVCVCVRINCCACQALPDNLLVFAYACTFDYVRAAADCDFGANFGKKVCVLACVHQCVLAVASFQAPANTFFLTSFHLFAFLLVHSTADVQLRTATCSSSSFMFCTQTQLPKAKPGRQRH